MKKLFIFILIIITTVYAQHPHKGHLPVGFGHFPLYSNVIVIPGNNNSGIINYTYRVPYNRLYFTKNGEKYNAGFSITVEVYDNDNKIVTRDIKENKITVDKFSDTNSGDLYMQGFIEFDLPDAEYDIKPSITDLNSKDTYELENHHIKKNAGNNSGILPPLVINKNKLKYDNNTYPVLTNFNGFVPFSNENYDLYIPCTDTSVNKIFVILINNRDTLKKEIQDSYLSNNNIKEINGNIVLANDSGKIFRNFILKGFSNSLIEGPLVIKISKNNENEYTEKFLRRVEWFDKPISFRNPEFAIKALKYMVSDSVISKMLDANEEEYRNELYAFWKKYDPTPSTGFNELLSEYYKRVDYALKNFSSITGVNGAESDRGKIFIKFGKPSSIKRSSDDYGRVVETWTYSKEKLNFVFVDKNGTGEFPLVKG